LFSGLLLVNIEEPAFYARQSEKRMFAVGHISLGYLIAKIVQKPLKTRINLPLIFLLSIIPDVDLLIPTLEHRGITHSLLVLTIAFVPFFAIYRKNSLPYFAALIQHSIIGDLPTNGGAQMLWPLTDHVYGLGIEQYGIHGIALELASFLLALAVLVATNDWRTLFQHKISNLLLVIPSGVILVSMVIGVRVTVPRVLLIPHMVLLAIFAASIFKLVLTKK